VSVVAARAANGETTSFPVAENEHRNGILDVSIVPARVPDEIARKAESCAQGVAAKLGYTGVLAVEFFVTEDGELLVNEIAPRPHNSGHYTIDACATSQFEQQVRTLCGLPLGGTRLLAPVVMVNLLGDVWQHGQPQWHHVFAAAEAKLHLYGKQEARAGRKMGHYTVLGRDADDALAKARAIREKLSPDFNLERE
jgi:5-(carboxyamino)imidazole ribonucleotide synthase